MTEEPISSFVERNGFTADRDFILSSLNQIDATYKKVKQLTISLSAAKGAQQITSLLTQLSEAQKKYDSVILESNANQKALTATEIATAKAKTENAKATKVEADAALSNARAKKTESEATAVTARAAKSKADASLSSAKAAKTEADTALSTAKAKELERKYTEALTKEKEKLERQTTSELKNQEKLLNAYEQLKNKYQIAANTAKQLAAEELKVVAAEGANSTAAIEAANSTKLATDAAQKYYQQLVGIEKAVGQAQRQVGQYQQATFALTQVLREAPAFAYSFGTGISAISNNMPMLIDEFNNLKASTGSGMQAFKILAGSLFSFNALLPIAFLLIQSFSGEITAFFREVFTGIKSIEAINKDLAQFNKQAEQSKTAVEKLRGELEHLEKLSKINLEIKATAQPDLSNLSDDLTEIQAHSIDQLTVTQNLREEWERLGKVQSDATKYFRENASSKANEALIGGTIDDVLSTLDDADQKMYGALKKTNEALADAGKQVLESEKEQGIVYRQVTLARAELERQTAADRRKLIQETAKTEASIITTNNESILANERSTLEQRLVAIKRNYEAERVVITANRNAVTSDPTASATDKAVALKSANAEAVAAEVEYRDKRIQIIETYRLRDLTAQKEAFEFQKQLDADLQKELTADLLLSLQVRLQAQVKYTSDEKAILDAAFKLKLQQAGISDVEIAALEKDRTYRVQSKKITDAELMSLQIEYETGILKLNVQTSESINEIIKTNLTNQRTLITENIEAIKAAYEGLNVSGNIDFSKEIIGLNEAYTGRLLSQRAYNAKRKKLEQEYQQQTTENLIAFLQDQLKLETSTDEDVLSAQAKVEALKQELTHATTDVMRKELIERIEIAQVEADIAKASYEERLKLENQLAEAKKKLSNDATKNTEENEEKSRNAIAQTLEQISQLVGQISALGSALSERRLQDIRVEQDAVEQRYKKEIETIEQTAITETEKKERKSKEDARYAAQRFSLEQRERQENVKKARFEKEMAIFQIILNTAAAIVKALPNVPLSIATGVIGAVQLAAAIAQPLPKYFKGKDKNDRYEGLAHVGDGGRAELIISKDGRMEVTPATDTIRYIKSTDIIMPDAKAVLSKAAIAQTDRVINSGSVVNITNQSVNQTNEKMVETLKKEFKTLGTIIKNKKEVHFKSPSVMKHYISSNLTIEEFKLKFPHFF